MQVTNIDIRLVPDEKCWEGLETDPDSAATAGMFLGKTREDVTPLLEANYLIRCLDLMGMPDCAFGYYAVGFAEFALQNFSNDEDFGVVLGAFLGALSNRYICSPWLVLLLWHQTNPLFDKLFEKLSNSAMNAETKLELMQEFSELRIAAMSQQE